MDLCWVSRVVEEGCWYLHCSFGIHLCLGNVIEPERKLIGKIEQLVHGFVFDGSVHDSDDGDRSNFVNATSRKYEVKICYLRLTTKLCNTAESMFCALAGKA